MKTESKLFRAGALALTLGLAGMAANTAQADEAAARDIVKKMTDYLASQQTLSFDFDANLQVVTPEDQVLDIASSGSMAVARPDKFRAIRHGGFATVEAVFDGKILSVLNATANSYGQQDMTGTLEDVTALLRDSYQRPLPAADLLASDAGAVLFADVTDVKDLGSGFIRGEECDHVALRSPQADVQLWVAQGEVPHPCRYSILSRDVAGSPSYTLEFSAWGAGSAPADFVFAAPEGAVKAELKDIADLDDLAGIYVLKGAN